MKDDLVNKSGDLVNDLVNDTISRAAAIDAIDGIPWYHQNQHGEMVHGANSDEHQAWYKAEDIYNVLDTLPPAQPETANIIVGKSRNGMTMWYQCDNCNEPVDENDLYCRGCGRRLKHG